MAAPGFDPIRDRIAGVEIEVRSPAGNVTVTCDAEARMNVRIRSGTLRRLDEQELGEELGAALTQALAACRRVRAEAYTQWLSQLGGGGVRG